jgi:hypothetical protein
MTEYVKFAHIRLGEDILQNIALLNSFNSIVFIDDILYNYRFLDCSASHGFSPKQVDDIMQVYSAVEDLLKSNGLYSAEAEASCYRTYLKKILELFESMYTGILSRDERYSIIKKVCDDLMIQRALKLKTSYSVPVYKKATLIFLKIRCYYVIDLYLRMVCNLKLCRRC